MIPDFNITPDQAALMGMLNANIKLARRTPDFYLPLMVLLPGIYYNDLVFNACAREMTPKGDFNKKNLQRKLSSAEIKGWIKKKKKKTLLPPIFADK